MKVILLDKLLNFILLITHVDMLKKILKKCLNNFMKTQF